MEATQRYELIRPILNNQKTPKQVHQETGTPLSTLYGYLTCFRQSGGQIESLAEKSHAIHSHPKWLTSEDKAKVVTYKLAHPHESSRQIAKGLEQAGILSIHNRTVVNILKARDLSAPFFLTNPQS